jgi:tetratricopeptide (TPR) repeat protein
VNRLFLVLALAACVTGCRRGATVNPEAGYFKTHFQDESQYIVESIVADIAEMATYGKAHKLSQGIAVTAVEETNSELDTPTYHVTVQLAARKVTANLHIDRPIWAPELYAEITSLIFKAEGLGGKSPGTSTYADTTLIKSLLTLSAVNIERENDLLSQELEANFLKANLHENAALLLGAFGFRERFVAFYDVRGVLCRMTAHLAMAHKMSNGAEPGPAGKVADALLYTLMENEADGAARAKALDTNQPEVASWSRALYARNTKDYRALEGIPQRSLAETFEYFQACCLCLDPDKAWEQLSDRIKTNHADPCRILAARGVSVELGHVLLETSMQLELTEMNLIYRMTHQRSSTNESLAEILNSPPERCFAVEGTMRGHVRVIGWGQWAMYFQRHLCSAIVDNFNFLQYRWCVPDQAAAYADKVDKPISGLVLYPFVKRLICTNEQTYRAAIDLCYPASQRAPHLFNSYAWNQICFPVSFAEFYQPFPSPHINDWYKHNPPPGTAYDAGPRTEQPNILERSDAFRYVESLHEKAPYSWTIVDTLLHIKYHDAPTFEEEEPLLRPVLAYDANSMATLASTKKGDPAAYETLMLKSAENSPDAYLALGDYCANRGEDEKAMRYLEKGMDFDRNGVTAAAHAGALMRLYLKHGQESDAATLVDKAAEVYSYDGIKAKADFLEATGRYAEAARCYENIEERYGSNTATIDFLLRAKTKTGKGDFDEAIAQHVRLLFPSGIERVTLSSFGAPPDDGVLVSEESAETKKAHLRKGAVIVALHGMRVHSFQQFVYARDSVTRAQLDMIVWQDHQYLQVTATPPNRRFGVHMPDYKRK